MARRKRLRAGDVFTIPLDDERVGYGQIVHSSGHGHYYFAVFEEAYSRREEPDLEAVIAGRLALLALSLDALLYHGHWRVVGHREVDPQELPWPAYKEAVSPDSFQVVDYTGERGREATTTEAEQLPFRAVVAPIVVEDAFKALHGLAEWEDVYDKLRPVSEERTSTALLSDA